MWGRGRNKPSQQIVTALETLAPREQLTAAGFTDDESAWRLLEAGETLDQRIAQIGCEKQEFLTAFTQGAIDVTNRYGYSKAELSWFDWTRRIFALTVMGLVCVLVWRTFFRPAEWRVVAAHDLPALAPLRPGDLKLEQGPSMPGEFKDIKAVTARYPLTEVKQGTALAESSLSTSSWKLPGRDSSLMEVPLKSAWDFGGWTMPVKAMLIESPRQGGAGVSAVSSLPVLIVAVKRQDGTTSVVFSTADADRVRREAFLAALGSSDVYAAVTPP
jgi:hypothetical protein